MSFLWLSSSTLGHLSSVVSPAGNLVDDVAGVPAVAYSEVGSGRITAMSDELFWDGAVNQEDNQLIGNQAVDWLVQQSAVREDGREGGQFEQLFVRTDHAQVTERAAR